MAVTMTEKPRKRKSGTDLTPAAKKPKTTTDDTESTKTTKFTSKKSSKHNDATIDNESVTQTAKPSRTERVAMKSSLAQNALAKENIERDMKKTQTAKKSSKKQDAQPEKSDDNSESEDFDASNMLLAGFSDSEQDDEPEDKGIAIEKIPAIPDDAALKKQLQANKKTADGEDTPGVLYIGRIPTGFFEHQMRAYFSQFGDITRLRLARNKSTGKPKHYAFLEFASSAVADIVAKTMDKYLMFGHILQVRRIDAKDVHPELWKGANKRFKAMPKNKLEGGLLRRGASREQWDARAEKESKRRVKKSKKLAEMGYEFTAPTLRSTDTVPVKVIEAAVPEHTEQEKIEATQDKETNASTAKDDASPAVKRKKSAKPSTKTKKARLST